MATRTGTPSQVNASAGNGSTSVTVPVGANGAVAFWAHWDGDGGSTLATLTLGGNSFTVRSQIAEGATAGESGAGVATLTSLPAAGSQTLAWTWSAGGARSEGGEIVIVWIASMNVSDPYRDAKTAAGTGSGNVSVTVTTDATDLLIAFAQRFTGGNPALDGTVFINDATVNSETYDVSEVTPGAGSTVINMSGEDYSSMAAISLKPAGGGTTYNLTLSGGITPAAVLARTSTKLFGGGMTPSASIAKTTTKAFAAGITPSATLARTTTKALAGGMTPSGALVTARTYALTLTGALSSIVGVVVATLVPGGGSPEVPTVSLAKRIRRASKRWL